MDREQIMKIRKGFVSNSSSSSYIIALTRDFKITTLLKEKILGEFYDMNYYNQEEELADDVVEAMIKEAINQLCSRNQIYKEECSYGGVSKMVPAVVHALKDEIVITTVDNRPDAESYCNVLSDNKRKEFLTKISDILEKEKNEN